jgi:hypothetical protein
MAKHITICAGIDTGKRKLDVALDGSSEPLQVDNTPEGYKVLLDWIRRHRVKRVGIEASGGYEQAVVAELRFWWRRPFMTTWSLFDNYFPPANVILPLRLRGIEMAGISFMLALLLGGAAFLFRQAATEVSVGTPWASDVCSTSQLFCHQPQYLFYAAGVMLVIAIGAKLGSIAT